MATTTKKTTKVAKVATEVKSIDQLNIDLVAKQIDFIAAKRGHRLGELTNPRPSSTDRRSKGD